MADLLSRIKDLSGAFAGASAVLYAFGYLMVRSRSRALGTDPDFALIDQAYVFAGVRFLMTTMVAFLIAAPIVVAARCLARAAVSTATMRIGRFLQVIAVLALAAVTLGLLFAVLESGGLFACGPSAQPQRSLLRAAVVGHGLFGALAVLLGTGVTALSIAWLWERRASADPAALVSLVLVAVVGLQAVLLPLQVGAYYPDLKTRELMQIPAGTRNLTLPLWIIDRGSQRTVLLTRSSDNRFALVTVRDEALDGIATTGTMLDAVLTHGDLACSAASPSPSG